MKRTNIYLTEEQQRRIGRIANGDRMSKAAVVRALLDDALGITPPDTAVDDILDETFGLWADRSEQELERTMGWRGDDRFERLGL